MTDICNIYINIVTTKENEYSPETQPQTQNAFLVSEIAGDTL